GVSGPVAAESEAVSLETLHDRGQLRVLCVVERALHLAAGGGLDAGAAGRGRGAPAAGRAAPAVGDGRGDRAHHHAAALLQVLRLLLPERDERGRRLGLAHGGALYPGGPARRRV